ncbi:hypothetical protein THAOC_21819, partial [Thalassiosira oceanica]
KKSCFASGLENPWKSRPGTDSTGIHSGTKKATYAGRKESCPFILLDHGDKTGDKVTKVTKRPAWMDWSGVARGEGEKRDTPTGRATDGHNSHEHRATTRTTVTNTVRFSKAYIKAVRFQNSVRGMFSPYKSYASSY